MFPERTCIFKDSHIRGRISCVFFITIGLNSINSIGLSDKLIIYSDREPDWSSDQTLSSPFLLGILLHRFQQQASISLLHQEAQLPEGRVVYWATALQRGYQLLVLLVALQNVPDGEDGPLADDWMQLVKDNFLRINQKNKMFLSTNSRMSGSGLRESSRNIRQVWFLSHENLSELNAFCTGNRKNDCAATALSKM